MQANGGIKDSNGRVHVALEHWLESILGNNIPVSSAYAWNKVRLLQTGMKEKSEESKMLHVNVSLDPQAEGEVPTVAVKILSKK